MFCILLLHGPWYQVRLSVYWNQTDETGAGYSAIFLGFWVAHQIWGWSLHTYLACLWGLQQFSQPCDYRLFQICHCNLTLSSQSETDDDFGVQPNKNLSFASLFSIVDTLDSIIQDIDANQYDSMERDRILFCLGKFFCRFLVAVYIDNPVVCRSRQLYFFLSNMYIFFFCEYSILIISLRIEIIFNVPWLNSESNPW